MDAYILNPDLELLGLVEDHESFIWTDRYSEPGDFEYKGSADRRKLDLMQPGNFVTIEHSNRLMVIEDMTNESAEEQGATLTAVGRSVESFLENRLVPPGFAMTASARAVVHELIRRTCVLGTGISPLDVVPNLTVSTNTSGTAFEREYKVGPLYATIKEVLDDQGLALRITRPLGGTSMHAEVYQGAVSDAVFSVALDTLSSPSWFNSNKDFYNVAYVYTKDFSRIVTLNGAGSGFYRRVLSVDASDLEDLTAANYAAKLDQRGREELAKHKRTSLFDGEIDPNGTYKYGTHYNLGDIVRIADSLSHSAMSQLTEYIWASDSEGFRAYPTFTTIDV